MLFEALDKRIMNLSPAVKKEYKKLYVAYKLDTSFVDIVFQKQRLRISINMKFSEINDPIASLKCLTMVFYRMQARCPQKLQSFMPRLNLKNIVLSRTDYSCLTSISTCWNWKKVQRNKDQLPG